MININEISTDIRGIQERLARFYLIAVERERKKCMREGAVRKRTSVVMRATPYTKGTLVFYIRPAPTLVFCTRSASSSSSMRSRCQNLDTGLTDSINPFFPPLSLSFLPFFFISFSRSIFSYSRS